MTVRGELRSNERRCGSLNELSGFVCNFLPAVQCKNAWPFKRDKLIPRIRCLCISSCSIPVGDWLCRQGCPRWHKVSLTCLHVGPSLALLRASNLVTTGSQESWKRPPAVGGAVRGWSRGWPYLLLAGQAEAQATAFPSRSSANIFALSFHPHLCAIPVFLSQC